MPKRANSGEISFAPPSVETAFSFAPARRHSYGTGATKRILDVVISLGGLSFFAILYPLFTLVIKLDSRGPVLVKLPRVSGGSIIGLYKFRTMVAGAHTQKKRLRHLNERGDGPFFKMTHDPRVTRAGRIIRRFRLDEVPQFINVLRGELSVVGPRPHELQEVAQYPDEFKFLTRERAGITGLSQINGASSLPFSEELEHDGYYAQHKSLWLDLAIMGKTAIIMLFDPSAV
ncbi:MAG: hypothetical protein COU11_03130 [Candidatus Harrisonbacteria bacterium CG10_big_fil_rev_8_21_14_0_10_49_15]|uniref:Bacterial sugar transferase domain-containing protein n=1 Tax=Candidatus Harrisonbacteria bacterium CG10_big_fil_rev_8_21_14_0_10_49_15 TaxID=1974587 RepID=A0A2H0UKQ1_9BACT|nr:MAG: hypothetical protein COU11_03130 [Candidatus Harrisonbacteria bacterium CG10_big_fil_rev_8_21_14_0_10_49_15]